LWWPQDRGYEVEMAKGKIVRNYLGGWFFIDLLATVQWSCKSARCHDST